MLNAYNVHKRHHHYIIHSMIQQIGNLGKKIVFQWIAAHYNFLGIERSDMLVKIGSTIHQKVSHKSLYESIKCIIKNKIILIYVSNFEILPNIMFVLLP